MIFPKILIFCLLSAATIVASEHVRPPKPLLPIPTARQLAWQKTELAMFLHFGVNTFADREWGEGSEDPAIFNPVEMDASQWARVAKETGFQKLILTAKHHDGFCLWPSRYTEHSVKNSPWQNGNGDVVKEFMQACREYGLQMGLYLSPWDRHEPSYGDSPAYNLHYLAQLRELMTQYGPLAEIWFDGACGEGPNGKKQVYDFEAYWALVRQLQPNAVIFSDEGPDVRWIGNEHGFAGETCWSMMHRSKVTIGQADTKYLNTGDMNGPDWLPGECDVSIRKGWFWHPQEEPKSLSDLLDIYFKSVGRNGVLLLNVPPDRRGMLDERDVKRLYEFRNALDNIFRDNLAKSGRVKAFLVRGNSDEFNGQKILDNDPGTYWAADDNSRSGILEIHFPEPVEFNIFLIREPVAFGQRVAKYKVEIFRDGFWQEISRGSTIGNKKIDHVPLTKAGMLRLSIEESRACPLISEFGLYLNPYE